MTASDAVRVDKWLWSVRLYKSRTLASAACLAGAVHINGAAVKPSRTVHVGDVISARIGEITRTVKVVALLESRVGAKLVPQFMQDLTPAAEYQKQKEAPYQPGFRPKGSGRPTKKQRRQWEGFAG